MAIDGGVYQLLGDQPINRVVGCQMSNVFLLEQVRTKLCFTGTTHLVVILFAV